MTAKKKSATWIATNHTVWNKRTPENRSQ